MKTCLRSTTLRNPQTQLFSLQNAYRHTPTHEQMLHLPDPGALRTAAEND